MRRLWWWLVGDCRALAFDCWQWKWIIILIMVEVYRVHVEQRNGSITIETLQKIQRLIIEAMDLVKPGPRG
jgi:hypothetical protein